MYKEHLGADIDDYTKREAYKYNFLVIWKEPITAIYQNFDKRLKWKTPVYFFCLIYMDPRFEI